MIEYPEEPQPQKNHHRVESHCTGTDRLVSKIGIMPIIWLLIKVQ